MQGDPAPIPTAHTTPPTTPQLPTTTIPKGNRRNPLRSQLLQGFTAGPLAAAILFNQLLPWRGRRCRSDALPHAFGRFHLKPGHSSSNGRRKFSVQQLSQTAPPGVIIARSLNGHLHCRRANLGQTLSNLRRLECQASYPTGFAMWSLHLEVRVRTSTLDSHRSHPPAPNPQPLPSLCNPPSGRRALDPTVEMGRRDESPPLRSHSLPFTSTANAPPHSSPFFYDRCRINHLRPTPVTT